MSYPEHSTLCACLACHASGLHLLPKTTLQDIVTGYGEVCGVECG